MGYKPTSKMQIVAIIAVVLLIIGGAILILKKIGLFDSSEEFTKESYSSYDEFLKDVNGTFINPLPDGASDFKYYVSKNEDSYDYIVSFTADSKCWFDIHNHYISYFTNYANSDKYIEEEEMKISFLDTEGLSEVKQMIAGDPGTYRIVRYAYSEGTSSGIKNWTGVLYNKESGRVVIFDSYY